MRKLGESSFSVFSSSLLKIISFWLGMLKNHSQSIFQIPNILFGSIGHFYGIRRIQKFIPPKTPLHTYHRWQSKGTPNHLFWTKIFDRSIFGLLGRWFFLCHLMTRKAISLRKLVRRETLASPLHGTWTWKITPCIRTRSKKSFVLKPCLPLGKYLGIFPDLCSQFKYIHWSNLYTNSSGSYFLKSYVIWWSEFLFYGHWK